MMTTLKKHICQRKPAGLMVPIHPQRPWEYAGVDYVGPLPRTPNGNAYILVFVDYFSKWIEVSAVKEATAQVAANKFITDFFARHGAPSYLISDRGTPFASDFVEHIVSMLGTEHRCITSYHPQTNVTEGVNKHTSWDKFIPQICFTLHIAPHESTGRSPSMTLYGRELEAPLDLVTQPSNDGMDDPGIPYPECLKASRQEKHYYDLRRHQVSYSIGDLVRIKTHARSEALTNFTAKLAPLYAGPYYISQRLPDVNYSLTKADTGEEAGVFHVVTLQPFYTWATVSSNKCKAFRSL
uniref:Integrase catalytic domain-containing protein n=1 Tax=Stegastes partitus TaxID=144197 RepID=A0A3B5ALH6_9TELE